MASSSAPSSSAFYRCTTCGFLAQKSSHACKMSSSLNHLNGLPFSGSDSANSSIPSASSGTSSQLSSPLSSPSIKNAAVVSASSLGNNKTEDAANDPANSSIPSDPLSLHSSSSSSSQPPAYKRWTREEDSLLSAVVKQFGGKNWIAIAAQVPDRTSGQCNARWNRSIPSASSGTSSQLSSPSLPRKRWKHGSTSSSSAPTSGRWSTNEHTLFLEALNLYGREWKRVADYIKTRNITQIRSHAQKYFAKLEKESAKGIHGGAAAIHGNNHVLLANAFSNGTKKKKKRKRRQPSNTLGKKIEVSQYNGTHDLLCLRTGSLGSSSSSGTSNYDDDNNDNINDNNDMSDDEKNSGSGHYNRSNSAVQSRWTQQEKRAFEEGLKHHGRGRWKLFLPLIPTKTQLQIRQHAYMFFKKRRLQALRQLKRDRGDPETSESESESDSESDNDTDRGSNSFFTAENSGQDDGSTPFHKKRKKKKTWKKK